MLETKIVSLLAFRNEEHFLPIYLESMSEIADVMLGYDDRSEDNSRSIFLRHGGELIPDFLPEEARGRGATVEIRKQLLTEGRRHGGTHFIVLDADEFFSGETPSRIRQEISKLAPSQKMLCDWIMLSSDCRGYRNESSVWKPNSKDFAFADRIDLVYPANSFVHFARTPQYCGESYSDHAVHSSIKVIHLQFINWKIGQVKQCWYRMQESIYQKRSHASINKKYEFTKEKESEQKIATLDQATLDQISTLHFESIKSARVNQTWYFHDISRMIFQYPRFRFQNLDIWHVDEIRLIYEKRFGKSPKDSRLADLINRNYLRVVHMVFLVKQTITNLTRIGVHK